MVKYSVIVPVYNADKYLDRCISSILAQSTETFELILVDDGSTDSSLHRCRQYAAVDPRVVVIHQDNAGVSAARNAGLRAAKGSYVLFVDADDYVSSDYLCTIDRYAGKYDLLEFGHYDFLVDKNDGELSIKPSKMNCDLEANAALPWKDLFMNSFFASPWNKLYKRELLEGIPFDTACVCYEDYLFNVAYCKRVNSFRVISNPLYYYRQSAVINPVTKRKWGKRFDISRTVARATEDFISKHSGTEDIAVLHAYPYGAFLVELQAAKLSDKREFMIASDYVVRDTGFASVISEFPNAGRRIEILNLLIKMKQYRMASFWLRKALVK